MHNSASRPRAFRSVRLLAAIVVACSLALLLLACVPITPEAAEFDEGGASTPVAPGLMTESTPITATVLVNSLNLRGGPATNHAWLGNVRQRATLRILGQINACAWLLAERADGVVGWISGDPSFLQLSVPCREAPAVAANLLPTPPPTRAPTPTRIATSTPMPTPTVTTAPLLTTTARVTVAVTLSATLVATPTQPATATTEGVTVTTTPVATADDTITATPDVAPTVTEDAVTPPSSEATSVVTTTISPSATAETTPTPANAIVIPPGTGCVRISNYVGPELTISFTSLVTGEGETGTVPGNQARLFCLPPARYTVTADAPPPWNTLDFEIEIEAGTAVDVPLLAR